jgi:uncharacterized membrane protein
MPVILSHWTEFGLNLASFALLAGYHLRLYRRFRKEPMTTAIGVTNHARRVWVQVIVDGNRDILAVQTLRNWVMASTFLASTSILISLGLVASVFRTEVASAAVQALNVFGHPGETLWSLKLLVLAALFFYAFFNFTLSIRYYNHAGLLLNVPSDREPFATVDAITVVLNHGALHYTLGMRGYYLAVPLGLWLFGPVWMLAGAVLTVFLVNRLDREV